MTFVPLAALVFGQKSNSGRIILAGDQLGIKPFYYTENSRRFRCASTLPALLAGGDIDTSLDPVALHHYFSFHAAVPAPRTVLRGVRKLPPATVLTIDPDGSKNTETFIAKRFGTNHQQIRVDAERALTALPRAMQAMSEPMVSHDTVAFYLLSEEVSRHVKVVQSGQGR
jgi:asparagine synthase (glutamine-hydrolysing)